MSDKPDIIKTANGYEQDYGIFSHRMVWDEYGAYLGQWQLNCLDDHPEAPTEIFLRAQGNEAGQWGLTQEQMGAAQVMEMRE